MEYQKFYIDTDIGMYSIQLFTDVDLYLERLGDGISYMTVTSENRLATPEEAKQSITENGYAASIKGKREISLYIEPNRITDWKQLVYMLSHELGHSVRPFRKDKMKEERKAQRYQWVTEVAVVAADYILTETGHEMIIRKKEQA